MITTNIYVYLSDDTSFAFHVETKRPVTQAEAEATARHQVVVRGHHTEDVVQVVPLQLEA
jgi:hypothetical protein